MEWVGGRWPVLLSLDFSFKMLFTFTRDPPKTPLESAYVEAEVLRFICSFISLLAMTQVAVR